MGPPIACPHARQWHPEIGVIECAVPGCAAGVSSPYERVQFAVPESPLPRLSRWYPAAPPAPIRTVRFELQRIEYRSPHSGRSEWLWHHPNGRALMEAPPVG